MTEELRVESNFISLQSDDSVLIVSVTDILMVSGELVEDSARWVCTINLRSREKVTLSFKKRQDYINTMYNFSRVLYCEIKAFGPAPEQK